MNYKVTGNFELEIESADSPEEAKQFALNDLVACIREYPEQAGVEFNIKVEAI